MPAKKTCKECGLPSGHKVRCPVCHEIYLRTRHRNYDRRKSHLKSKYGITIEFFESLWLKQSGKCAICELDMKRSEKRQGQTMNTGVIDHCHSTGIVRGLLCSKCNITLGQVEKDPHWLSKALEYLKGAINA